MFSKKRNKKVSIGPYFHCLNKEVAKLYEEAEDSQVYTKDLRKRTSSYTVTYITLCHGCVIAVPIPRFNMFR